MVSVAELLNPEPARAPVSSVCRTLAFRNELPPVRPSTETLKMDGNVAENPSRCRVKGVINFPPFENLDEAALREVRKFQVYPLGSIQESPERIPYNSGKKDFFAKTGREGFEVFHYDFKVPGDDTLYTVMWDYSVGLIRMTPFFKCRGYSKTTPAKMLNQNPGLKDITHSITGGSIKAQGYWMPFSCAKAVCATFCHKIAGALIPLFGPQFPYECIPEKATGHGRMIISPEIVARAKADAAARFKPAALPSPRPSRSTSPLPRCAAPVSKPYDHHSDYEKRLLLSPYTDTDTEYHPGLEPYNRRTYPTLPPLRTRAKHAAPTPLHSPGWIATNAPQAHPHPAYHRRAVSHLNDELLSLNVSSTAHPWLSALPRSSPPAAASASKLHPCYPRLHQHQYQTSPLSATLPDSPPITLPPLRLKRPFDQVEPPADKGQDEEDDYDAGESHTASSSPMSAARAPLSVSEADQGQDHQDHDREEEDTNINIRAPPPSPAGESNPKSCTPPPSRGIGSGADEFVASGADDAITDARHEAEREAAIMLMYMMRGRAGSCSYKQGQQRQGQIVVEKRNDTAVGSGGSATKDSDGDTAPAESASSAGAPATVVQTNNGAVVGPLTRSKRRRTMEP